MIRSRFRHHLLRSFLVCTMTCGITSLAYALPVPLNNSGSATISTNGNQMNIAGKGLNNILMWSKFNVGTGEAVNFVDRNNYLNLVQGGDISRIYGTLRGGNIVYLVNPNGILFGDGARIDNMGSFIASTRNISSINQDAFLTNPALVQNVLGVDSEVMDNQRYYSTNSPKNKISMADLQLTNVPDNGGLVLLDGPGGVILKNKAQLDKVTQVITRKNGGEVGIGTENGSVSLSETDKSKIVLVDGSNYSPFNESVLQPYKIINTLQDLQSINVEHRVSHYLDGIVLKTAPYGHYLLGNNINATGLLYGSVFAKGDFDGLGYSIDNLSIRDDYNFYVGLFGEYYGNIRNLSINNISINATCAFAAGGVAGAFQHGSINNVSVSGVIKSYDSVGGLIGAVGADYDFLQDHHVEIRNSKNSAFLTKTTDPKLILIEGLVFKATGGLVGQTSGSLKELGIYNSVNMGDMERKEASHDKMGGIIANTEVGKIKIVDTYNLGNINCSNPYTTRGIILIGGIVGGDSTNGWTRYYGKISSYELDNVYNLGTIKMDFDLIDDDYWNKYFVVGGIIGLNNPDKNIANAFYIKDSIVNKGSIVRNNLLPTEDSRHLSIMEDLDGNKIYTVNEGLAESASQVNNRLNPDLFGVSGTFESVWVGKSAGVGSTDRVVIPSIEKEAPNNPSYTPNKEYFEALPNKAQINSAIDSNMKQLEEYKQQHKTEIIETNNKGSFYSTLSEEEVLTEHYKDIIKVNDFIDNMLSSIMNNYNSKVDSILCEELKKKVVISNSSVAKWKIPEGLYDAFLEPIARQIAEANIDAYDSDLGYNFVLQLMGSLDTGLKKIPEKVVIISGTEYTINYDLAWSQNKLTTVVANVTWDEGEKTQKATLTLSNYNDPAAIQSYVNSLKKLSENVVENAMLEFASYGLKDLADKDTVKAVYKLSKELVMAVSSEENAKQFLMSLGSAGYDYLVKKDGFLGLVSESATEKVKKLVEKTMGGVKKLDKFVNTVIEYNNKKDAYVDALRKSKSGDAVKDLQAEYFLYKETVDQMMKEYNKK